MQMQSVIVAPPRCRNFTFAFNHLMGNALCAKTRRRGESGRAGANHQNIVIAHRWNTSCCSWQIQARDSPLLRDTSIPASSMWGLPVVAHHKRAIH